MNCFQGIGRMKHIDGKNYFEDGDVLYEVLATGKDGEYEVSEVGVTVEDDVNYGRRTHLRGKSKSWYQGDEFSSYQGLYLTKEAAQKRVDELKNRFNSN